MDMIRSLFAKEGQQGSQSALDSVLQTALAGPQPLASHAEQFEDQFEDAWEAAEVEPPFEEIWEQQQPEQPQTVIQGPNPSQFKDMDEFTEFWQEMCTLAQGKDQEYVLDPNNPYIHEEQLYERALEFSRNFDLRNAILALEAELVKNPSNSEAWVLLGQLNAENDEDSRAIASFLRGHENDPYNLECLLQLGISLIN